MVRIFIFFLTLITAPYLAWADHDLRGKKIHIVYADNWDPVSYHKGKRAKGLLPEKMEKILSQAMGMQVTHTPVPWARAQNMIKHGTADAFITTPTPERLTFATKSRSIVFVLPFVAAVKKYSDAYDKLKNPDDLSALADSVFCDVLGNGWADYFYKDKLVTLHTAPTIKECLKLLNAGRVDAIIHAAPVLNKYVKELSLSDEIEVRTQSSQKSPQFPLLISKKSHLGQDFLDQFDAYFEEHHLDNMN